MLQCGFVRANLSLAMSLALSSSTSSSTPVPFPATPPLQPWSRGAESLYQPTAHLPQGPAPAAPPKSRRHGAGEGNRTPVVSLEGCCSTIELHPQAAGRLVERVGFKPTYPKP